jgi:hypothetical protein
MNSSCSQPNSDPQGPVVACQALCYLCVGCTECPPGLVWPSGLRSIPACKRSSRSSRWIWLCSRTGLVWQNPMVYHGLYDLYGLWFFRNSHLVPKAWILRVARFFRVMPAVLIRYFRTRNQVPWAAKTWRTTKPTNFDSVNDGKEIWE